MPVRKICKELQEFSYLEVKNKLKERTRPKEVAGQVVRKRRTVGCFLPTDRQLQQFLVRADWCAEVQPAEKHRPARYRFVSSVNEASFSLLTTGYYHVKAGGQNGESAR